MIQTVLLAAITGMLIGKWICEPLIDIYREYKGTTTFKKMWEKNDWKG
jgi:hypothetical protein